MVFVQSLGQQVIALLADENLSPVDRRRVFTELLIDRFDIPSIGRLVMGRYWRRTTEAQRDLFEPLFESFVITTYSRRLDAYAGEQLTSAMRVRPARRSRPSAAGSRAYRVSQSTSTGCCTVGMIAGM